MPPKRIMFGFVPKQKTFFDLFDQLAETVDEGAKLLLDATRDDTDTAELQKRIKIIEHQGDEITHKTIEEINKSFVTPLDREDIHELTCRLDDILDLVDTAATRIVLYKIALLTGDAKEMAAILAKSTDIVKRAVKKLRSARERRTILQDCIEIHTCENQGDRLEQHALAALFDNHHDAVDIIKWKDIYDDLETAIDKCEDVANVLESLVLKSS